ncbi:hypothetical protein PIB30_012859, partial [Stylosanthes scabra]|nr:hypothetical protein [Stylosanthes scabra]
MITEVENYDLTYRHLPYTVYVNDHRILNVYTTSPLTLSRWLTDLLKSTPKNNPVLVGVTAEHQSTEYTKRGVKDHPYDYISLCVGSHCLIYPLPEPDDYNYAKRNPKPLRDFFANPRVIAVGMEIEKMKTKLEKHHQIELKKAMDLRAMAVEGLKEEGEKLDLRRYDLDKLAKTVLGKHVDVVRPEKKVEWYDETYYWYNSMYSEMTEEKVMFITIDTYLCYLIGLELNDLIHGNGSDKSQDSCKSKKK